MEFSGPGGGDRDPLPFQILQLLRVACRNGGGEQRPLGRPGQDQEPFRPGNALSHAIATAKALNSPADFREERNRIFQERRDILAEGLNRIGLKVFPPRPLFTSGPVFPWAIFSGFLPQGPGGDQRLDDPGSIYGKYGKDTCGSP